MLSLLLVLLALDATDLPVPSGFHLGSYSSTLSARLGSDGRLDSGAGVIQLVDGDSGEPLPITDARYGVGPALYVAFTSRLGAIDIAGVTLGARIERGGDERVSAPLQIKCTNASDEAADLHLQLRLSPGGGGDPLLRPLPSLPFDADATFSRSGDQAILRDENVLLLWAGPAPTVELTEHAAAPDDVVATLTWELQLEPGESRFLEFRMAGPPASGTVDEDAWRARFFEKGYGDLEEDLRWEANRRGVIANFDSASRPVWRTLIGGIAFLRSLGIARYGVEVLSDRPYGHPATDTAAEAEVLAILMEWSFEEIGAAHVARLMDQLDERLEGLAPDRRVAFLHAMARSIRLANDAGDLARLGAAIETLTELEHEGPIAVAPFLDPDAVRADLADILRRAGLEGADELPPLAWATVDDPDSTPGRMLAVRRAISERRAEDAWRDFAPLMGRSSQSGMGTMEADGSGELGGAYTVGMLTLVRAFLVDDHGDELVLFPAVSAGGLIDVLQDIDTTFLPTRFGVMSCKLFFVGPKQMGAWLIYRTSPDVRSENVVVHLPEGFRFRDFVGPPKGGTVQVLEDGSSFSLYPDPATGFNLRFTAKVRPAPGS